MLSYNRHHDNERHNDFKDRISEVDFKFLGRFTHQGSSLRDVPFLQIGVVYGLK